MLCRLARLSRFLNEPLLIVEELKAVGPDFRNLTEAIDAGTPAGRMLRQIVDSFAEFERVVLRERTRTEPDAARQEGRVGDRREEWRGRAH